MKKVIGKSLQAKVKIGNSTSFDTTSFLSQFEDLHQLFIVSQVEVVESPNGQDYQYANIAIEHAEGEQCARCWNYSNDLGSVGEMTALCPRCQEVVKTLK